MLLIIFPDVWSCQASQGVCLTTTSAAAPSVPTSLAETNVWTPDHARRATTQSPSASGSPPLPVTESAPAARPLLAQGPRCLIIAHAPVCAHPSSVLQDKSSTPRRVNVIALRGQRRSMGNVSESKSIEMTN